MGNQVASNNPAIALRTRPRSPAGCPVAELARLKREAQGAIGKPADGQSVYHAEDKLKAVQAMASHLVATSKVGLQFQVAELLDITKSLISGGAEKSPRSAEAERFRMVERLITLIGQGIGNLLTDEHAAAA